MVAGLTDMESTCSFGPRVLCSALCFGQKYGGGDDGGRLLI